ncbi:MAG: UDP-3-O-[3-hydroxymyristoyl] N-acetylglucosamine deacetylase, partial [Acidithiobacillus sp.]|nr:UDP-3-O-[3-hydroxymyristoyl] N-acetylglucosamine deacetylase [Acidithiobacillus sp.]
RALLLRQDAWEFVDYAERRAPFSFADTLVTASA